MYKSLLACWLLFSLSGPSFAQLDTVTLQLKWKHQFQFAGYYAAQAKGFYQEAGLHVTIKEAESGIDSVQEVVDGRAQFGVGTSELLLNRYRGDPIVILGVIFQHSPLALVTLRQSGIDNIHKLVDRKVMVEPNSAELFAYLFQEGITSKAFNLLHHSQDLNDLIQGKADAMSVYVTDEIYPLKQQQIEFNQFSPRMSGIDFYGDNLFTLDSEIKDHPDRVRAFREASFRGWRYAMQYPEEIIHLIFQQYTQRHSIEHLRHEAALMSELMRPELIDPGYMHLGRWQHIINTYHELGLLPEKFDVKSMLYLSNSEADLKKISDLLFQVSIVLLAISVLSMVLFNFYRTARANIHRLNMMFDHVPLSLIVLDKQFRVRRWNNTAIQTFQWRSEEMLGKSILSIIAPEDCHQVEQGLKDVLQQYKAFRSENRNIKQDGTTILCEWLNTPFQDRTDKAKFILCMARDITEQQRQQQLLEQAAHYDSLTNLPNRALTLELIKQSLALAARNSTKLGLLFLDLDGFKEINDHWGHDIGDKVLQAVAMRLSQGMRKSDYTGRLAGDEFLVILQDICTREDAQHLADKLQKLIAQPLLFNGEELSIQASIGISVYPDDARHVELLIQKADHNMYQIKRQRGRVR